MNRESYKEYVENAIAYNRKMNEERKMRIPYIDGQGRCFNGRTSNYIISNHLALNRFFD